MTGRVVFERGLRDLLGEVRLVHLPGLLFAKYLLAFEFALTELRTHPFRQVRDGRIQRDGTISAVYISMRKRPKRAAGFVVRDRGILAEAAESAGRFAHPERIQDALADERAPRLAGYFFHDLARRDVHQVLVAVTRAETGYRF